MQRPLAVLVLASLGACAAAIPPQDAAPPEPQDAFWGRLAAHCGAAYPGRLTLEPPGDEMLTGTEELVVHFRRCGADTLRVPFHIEKEETGTWDRSRTWVFIRHADGLELRHDHRQEDGSPDATTWYGGRTEEAGAPGRQEFVYAERRAADGSLLGWRVEIEPNVRYTYGTIRGGEWTWRVDFDLTRPLAEPPPPWGFEGT